MIKEKLIPIDVDLINKFMKIEEVLSKGVHTGTTHTSLIFTQHSH